MKKAALQIVILAVALTGVFSFVKAQESSDDGACTGPVYKGKEVSRKVKITSFPPPENPRDSRAGEVHGKVVLDVVACYSGQVTNIKVVAGQPYGWTEAAVKAAKNVKFRPAEKDGQQVSQWIRFEYQLPDF
jgi:TonB family protein